MEFGQAAQILGRGMCDNPADVRIFRAPCRQHRLEALTRFFGPVLHGLYQRGLVLGAFLDRVLVGVCGVSRPGFCQPTALEKLRLVPVVVYGNPLGTAMHIMKWAGDWARRDLRESHWHLGPVAVDPPFQGRGIGGAMLSAFCASIDAYGAVAYLETDKGENVRFYQKFGFTVIAEAEVLDVPNWFMCRRAAPAILSTSRVAHE